jgi:uncharacterized membrane protein YbhN (UPF0104 family)
MLPTTPGGVGVYEAGVVGLFRLLGWDPAEGAAYGILLRLDDVVFLAAAMAVIAGGGLPARDSSVRTERSPEISAAERQAQFQDSAATPEGRER